MTAEELAHTVTAELQDRFEGAMSRIDHCIAQLTDEQLWWRPHPSMNSIANLMLHLAGNLRQWVVSGVGGRPDERDRPREFSERGPIDREELRARLAAAVAAAGTALAAAGPDDLLSMRTVQNNDVTGLQAALHSLNHFHGHTQEIICLTRMQLGESYQFLGIPPGEPRT